MKKPLMHYTLLAAEGREDETIKYSQLRDLVLSVNLAARIHKDDKPKNAVRTCARMVEKRVTHSQVRSIIDNMCNPISTPDPVAFSTALLRSIREAELNIRRRMIRDRLITIND